MGRQLTSRTFTPAPLDPAFFISRPEVFMILDFELQPQVVADFLESATAYAKLDQWNTSQRKIDDYAEDYCYRYRLLLNALAKDLANGKSA